jgi:hypothetical protein
VLPSFLPGRSPDLWRDFFRSNTISGQSQADKSSEAELAVFNANYFVIEVLFRRDFCIFKFSVTRIYPRITAVIRAHSFFYSIPPSTPSLERFA